MTNSVAMTHLQVHGFPKTAAEAREFCRQMNERSRKDRREQDARNAEAMREFAAQGAIAQRHAAAARKTSGHGHKPSKVADIREARAFAYRKLNGSARTAHN